MHFEPTFETMMQVISLIPLILLFPFMICSNYELFINETPVDRSVATVEYVSRLLNTLDVCQLISFD